MICHELFLEEHENTPSILKKPDVVEVASALRAELLAVSWWVRFLAGPIFFARAEQTQSEG